MTRSARPSVTALIIGLAALLGLLALGLRAATLVGLGLAVVAPGLWWRWKTREFRRGVRELKRGRAPSARTRFLTFLDQAEHDGRFLRYQVFFNLGRPYDYIAAAHNNLGVLALSGGRREEARSRFETALGRWPEFAPAHYGHAATSILAGDLDAAERTTRAGLRADPGYRPCATLLALCRAERGDRAGARALLAKLDRPMSWDEARKAWASMYRFWGAEARAASWEEPGESGEGE